MNEAPHPRTTFPSALHGLILLGYGAFLTNPAWHSGYVIGRDTLIHLLWSRNFSDQFWAGEIYPRWLGYMNDGLGSPTFFFYGPLPYYITALLRPLLELAELLGLTGADPQGWHQLGLSASIAVILSGFAVYAWTSTFTTKTGALVASIVYMCAPFHLAIDLYERFGFAELWAFVWTPLLLLMVQRLCDGRRYAFTSLVLCYAALILTHLPTTLIFSPVPIAYSAWFSASSRRVKAILRTIAAMALGVGLAAIYFIPAMATQSNVSFADMHKLLLHYSGHFLYWGPRYNKDMEEFVGVLSQIATPMILMGCFAYFVIQRKQSPHIKHQGQFWLLLSLGTFFMMLPLSKPLWDEIHLLQVIQFPWRFHVVLTVATTALLALWLRALEGVPGRWERYPLVLAGITLSYQFLPTLIVYQAISRTAGEASLEKMMEQFGSRNEAAKGFISAAMMQKDAPEYRPRWVPHEFLFDAESIRIQVEQTRDDRLSDKIEIPLKEPRHIQLRSTVAISKWITVEHFYYPGWVATISEGTIQIPLQVRPSVPEGLLQIYVPAGERIVEVTLAVSPEEQLGKTISLASLALLLYCFWRERHLSPSPPKAPRASDQFGRSTI